MRCSPLIWVAALVAGGCCAKPDLTRRYKTLEWRRDDAFQPVLISATLAEIEAPVVKVVPAVLQLSDHGQAGWIQALSAGAAPQTDLLAALARPFPPAPRVAPVEEDACIMPTRVVLSTQVAVAPSITQADRIATLEFELAPVQDGFDFLSWNRFATEFGTVDLGKISQESSSSFSAKLAPTFSGDLVGVGEIGGGTSRVVTEELPLKERVLALSGILVPERAVVLQQGGLGLDLEGNISVDFVLRLPGTPIGMVSFPALQVPNWAGVAPAALEAQSVLRWIPKDSGADATASIRAGYGFRHVHEGHETIVESDDEVHFYVGGTAALQLTLVRAERIHRAARYYEIHDGQHVLKLGSGVDFQDMRFRTEKEAERFIQWLVFVAARGNAGQTIQLGTAPNQLELRLAAASLMHAAPLGGLASIERINTSVSPR